MSPYEQNPRVDTCIWTLKLPDEASTDRIAHYLTPLLHAGDMITLTGGLGAGKTAFGNGGVNGLNA